MLTLMLGRIRGEFEIEVRVQGAGAVACGLGPEGWVGCVVWWGSAGRRLLTPRNPPLAAQSTPLATLTLHSAL